MKSGSRRFITEQRVSKGETLNFITAQVEVEFHDFYPRAKRSIPPLLTRALPLSRLIKIRYRTTDYFWEIQLDF